MHGELVPERRRCGSAVVFALLCVGSWVAPGRVAAEPAASSGDAVARGGEAAPSREAGRAEGAPLQDVRISVLTMGPGDPTFSKFGHDAILVESSRGALVYNFGTFTFDSPTLIADFLKGRLSYWLSVDPLPRTLRSYRRQRRSMIVQELALDASAAEQLAKALVLNARPENRYYRYDYYRDNCSTRVRDALDRALSGGLARAAAALPPGPESRTYRDHTLRLVADDIPLSFGLDLALGPLADRRLGAWEEAFLPERLADTLRSVRVAGPSGPVPLVTSERELLRADRPAAPERPPFRFPFYLAVGLFAGATSFWLGRPRASLRAQQVGAALAVLIGLVGGTLGGLLAFLATLTDHEIARQNANALITPPWSLGLAVAGAAALLRRPRARRWLELSALSCIAGAVLGLVVSLITQQDTSRILALFLPLWLGSYLSARQPAPRKPAATVPPAPPNPTSDPTLPTT